MIRRALTAIAVSTALLATTGTAAAQEPRQAPVAAERPKPSNDAGVAVAVVMLAGWGGAGAVMFRRAARRRSAAEATSASS